MHAFTLFDKFEEPMGKIPLIQSLISFRQEARLCSHALEMWGHSHPDKESQEYAIYDVCCSASSQAITHGMHDCEEIDFEHQGID